MRDFLIDFSAYMSNNNYLNELDVYDKIVTHLQGEIEFDLESLLTVVDDISNISQMRGRFNHPSIKYLINKNYQSKIVDDFFKYENSEMAISFEG